MKCVGTTTGTSRPRPDAISSPKSRDARNVFHSSSESAASTFLIHIVRRLLGSSMRMRMDRAYVASVNVGRPREIVVDGRTVRTSIWKDPVAGRVAVRGVNVSGDDQSDRKVHGGDRKVVCAYAREDLDWWSARVGERWRIGTTLLEVTSRGSPASSSRRGWI